MTVTGLLAVTGILTVTRQLLVVAGLLTVLGGRIVALRLVVTGQASSACAMASRTARDGSVRTGLRTWLMVLVV